MKGLTKRAKNAPRRGAPVADSSIAQAVDAVCDELGISDRSGRAMITRHVTAAYRRGPRQPLNLVTAGLSAH